MSCKSPGLYADGSLTFRPEFRRLVFTNLWNTDKHKEVIGDVRVNAATKGALETLVKNWAAILGSRGIRVNAIAPGVIDTEVADVTKTEAGREIVLGMQALERIGQPEDVADVVAFLASDGLRWITGAIIPVDGGSKL